MTTEDVYKAGYNAALRDVEQSMYLQAFIKGTDLQRWDSGCWIRYKLFENVLAELWKDSERGDCESED